MGLRKLAYPIDKKSTGHYHLFEFKADPSIIARFELELKRDENILRFLTVSLDKHGVAFNERRRNGEWSKKSETEEKSA
ncbi:ribosomal protein S6 [Flammeovirga kamogawensis]|nr:ribosomal protein S6 [Flammeovirga kamogawensis]